MIYKLVNLLLVERIELLLLEFELLDLACTLELFSRSVGLLRSRVVEDLLLDAVEVLLAFLGGELPPLVLLLSLCSLVLLE